MTSTTIQSSILLSAVVLLSLVNAQVPVYSGLQRQRAALNNSLFFDPSKLPPIHIEGGVVSAIGDVDTLPSLALPDVNLAFALATLPPGKPFPKHEHPTVGELLLSIEGTLKVTITQELMLPPLVYTQKPGQIVVIPQGLPHETVCISKTPCKFFAFFNGPALGIVLVK